MIETIVDSNTPVAGVPGRSLYVFDSINVRDGNIVITARDQTNTSRALYRVASDRTITPVPDAGGPMPGNFSRPTQTVGGAFGCTATDLAHSR